MSPRNRRIAVTAAVSLAAAAALAATTTPAGASFYPPGYAVETTCQTNGPVEVCAINRHYGSYPRLVVRYDGYLLASQWGRVSAYVRLDGRDGTFRMENANYKESVSLGDPVTRLCWQVDSNEPLPLPAPPSGEYAWCQHTSAPGGGGIVWEADEPPAAEKSLFFYARDEHGLANAWDVSVALVADDGRWDSRNGGNYNFRFE